MFPEESLKSKDKYVDAHRLDRRQAVMDKFYLTSVTNKAFSDYFGKMTFGAITEFVHPDDKDDLCLFIDTFDGSPKSECFRFKNADGEYRQNLLRILSSESGGVGSMDIEMVDVDAAVESNYRICDDIMRERIALGLTGEYIFYYDDESHNFKITKCELYARDIIVRENIDEWSERVISNGWVEDSSVAEFEAFIENIKLFTPEFSFKFTTSIRTQGTVMETLKFIGTVYNKYNGYPIMIGRIISADSNSAKGQTIELTDELMYDSLTQVYNKKTITELAQKFIKEEKANKITIAIIDVDHFKKVNDVYGHLYGDKVLTRVARRIKDVVGEDGVVGRIGGDEFAVVLNRVNDPNDLRSLLRSIRTQVKWEFKNDFQGEFSVTTSIGAAVYPDNGRDYESLFKKADFCLYVAKEKGRDRYVFFRDDLHLQSFMDSSKMRKGANDGREMKELKFLTQIMTEYNKDRKNAIMNMFHHILETYNVDSINLFTGDKLEKCFTVGENIEAVCDAMYVHSENFKNLTENNPYAVMSFVGAQRTAAPDVIEIMNERGIVSTIQCIIGDMDNIKGVLTIDRTKNAAQWAEYEVECSVITASLINTLIDEGNLGLLTE